jgi:hypothetical protein
MNAHDADQSELPRMERWLPCGGIDAPEHLIAKETAELIAQPQI